MYMQVGQVGEEVVSYEYCEHNEIVDYTLEVVTER